jgi:hypothetical protein
MSTSETLGKINKHKKSFNSLNAELNPICRLLTLLGAHPILHVSGIKVKVCWAALGLQ